MVEGDPDTSISCRECHMPLMDSTDPAAGDALDTNRHPRDGRHRSHRFIGANQYHPVLLDLPGAAEQTRLTEEWLRGEIEIPEIAHKWTTGPAVPLEILAPEEVRPSEEVTLRVVVLNNKVGHDFPTGPLDIIQAWIDVEVRDDRGHLVFESGGLDENGFLPAETTVFKAEGIDQLGNLIDKHNLWEMVGARFKRTLFPGFADVVDYAFFCPDQRTWMAPPGVADMRIADPTWALPPLDMTVTAHPEAGELVVRARLRYRKVDQYFLDFLFPDRDMSAPITDMSWVEARIRVHTSDGDDRAGG
jgi:hypothetical protein